MIEAKLEAYSVKLNGSSVSLYWTIMVAPSSIFGLLNRFFTLTSPFANTMEILFLSASVKEKYEQYKPKQY